MFSLTQLSEQIAAYRAARIDLDAFEDWFRKHSWGSYDRSGDRVSDAIASVEAALFAYESEELNEQQLRQELEAAVRPLPSRPVAGDARVDEQVYNVWLRNARRGRWLPSTDETLPKPMDRAVVSVSPKFDRTTQRVEFAQPVVA